MLRCRAVAQLGRALEWGSRGREFKSLRPDFFFRISLHFSPETSRAVLFVIRLGVVGSMFSFRRLSLKKSFELSFYRPFGPFSFSVFLGPIEIVHLHSLALAKAPSATVSHASPNTPFTLRRTPASHSNNFLYQQHKQLDIILSF